MQQAMPMQGMSMPMQGMPNMAFDMPDMSGFSQGMPSMIGGGGVKKYKLVKCGCGDPDRDAKDVKDNTYTAKLTGGNNFFF